MRVKMKVGMSGTHNGVPFPAIGEEGDLPDHVAAKFVAAGLATAVKEEKRVEKAVADTSDVEKRGPGRPRKAAEPDKS